jgi:hypothetical protein
MVRIGSLLFGERNYKQWCHKKLFYFV